LRRIGVIPAAPMALATLLAASSALAEAAGPMAPPPANGTDVGSAGAEGSTVGAVIVTAEQAPGAKAAPVKASLDQTEPESIVSRDFIEQITPETGNVSTVIFIAPSISGISANAGGIGNYFSTTMRGFTDGEYNLTYDGIAFGDTNNPTHHPNDYFPTSEVGAAVVDRGPGTAGDLGQANYGGAIHYFSPTVSDTFGVQQRLTYGSFNTFAAVTSLNTGYLKQLFGGKLWINLDERRSDTELSHSGGYALNQMIKYVLPIGDRFTLTALATHAWSRYNFPDSNGPGETLPQIEAYGKNFQLTNIPDEEHWYKWNFERKQTYFGYLDLNYQMSPNMSIEDEPYAYFYSNKTDSTKDNSGLIGSSSSTVGAKMAKFDGAGQAANDIYGYLKRNDYNVYGDIIRFKDVLPFGVLKIGALVEGSRTYRQKGYFDFMDNYTPVYLYTPANDPLISTPTNYKLHEKSSWLQEQVFIDFNWTPTEALTISPGFKYVNFRRDVNALEENYGGKLTAPLQGTNTYNSPLYFITVNYKILKYWSVYGQFATSFLIPQLAELEVPGVNFQHLTPETTTNYQLGTVYSRGAFTADADIYLIDAANANVPCNVVANGETEAASCNAGNVTYNGIEAEAAYTLPFGLTFFANGSINDAVQEAQTANVQAGIAGNPRQELAATPRWTGAAGVLLHHDAWRASLTYKRVGSEVVYNSPAAGFPQGIKVPAYDTFNGSLAYDFKNLEVKLQCFNLFDRRALTNYVPEGGETTLYNPAETTSFYTFQSGRELQVTLIARY
jgi:iron complex outermembrane receptor protein